MSRVCTGCFVLFPKMHLLLNHRRTHRCGGEWNETVWIPTHRYINTGNGPEMIFTPRPGMKYDATKPPLPAPLVPDSVGAHIKRMRRRKKNRHSGRTPGAVRKSRMLGGSGFRNNWE